MIANTDTAINYDSGWKTLGGALSMMAPAAGAVMSFSFYGESTRFLFIFPFFFREADELTKVLVSPGLATSRWNCHTGRPQPHTP